MKYSEPTRPDECRCGLGANNGIAQVLLAQLFLFVGLCLSVATIGDCSLVILEEPIRVQLNSSAISDSIGMVSFRDMDTGRCFYWWQDYTVENLVDIEINMDFGFVSDQETTTKTIEGSGEQLVHHLLDVLGNDWFVPMGFFAAATGMALLFVVYSISYCCSTQVKACRFFTGVLVAVFLPLFQGLGTLLLFKSEWCDIQGCSLGRSTIFSIVAAILFLLSGVFFFIMENWPGQKELDKIDEERRNWESDEPYKKKKQRQSRRQSRYDDTSNDGGIPLEIHHNSHHNSYHTRSTHNRSTLHSRRRSNSRDSGNAFRDSSGEASGEVTKDLGDGSESSDNDLELMESAPMDEPSLSDRDPPRRRSPRNSPKFKPKAHAPAPARETDLYSDEFSSKPRKSVVQPALGGDIPRESMASTSTKQTSQVRNSFKKNEKISRHSKKTRNDNSDNNDSDDDDENKEPSGMLIKAPNSTYISVDSNTSYID